MPAITPADWPALCAAFSSFFDRHGTVEPGEDAIRFTAARIDTGVTVTPAGQVRAHMPLHSVDLTARSLRFDEATGELHVEGDGVRYCYRRPG